MTLHTVLVSRYESRFSCRISMENTSRLIKFLNLKSESDSTDVCRFKYTYKCTNHGSKQAHRLDTWSFFFLYINCIHLKSFSSKHFFCLKNFTRPIRLLMFHDH